LIQDILKKNIDWKSQHKGSDEHIIKRFQGIDNKNAQSINVSMKIIIEEIHDINITVIFSVQKGQMLFDL
jgi:hypothetical protein